MVYVTSYEHRVDLLSLVQREKELASATMSNKKGYVHTKLMLLSILLLFRQHANLAAL